MFLQGKPKIFDALLCGGQRKYILKRLPWTFQKNKHDCEQKVAVMCYVWLCLCCEYVCVVSLIKTDVFLGLTAERMENVKINRSGIDATVSSDHTHTSSTHNVIHFKQKWITPNTDHSPTINPVPEKHVYVRVWVYLSSVTTDKLIAHKTWACECCYKHEEMYTRILADWERKKKQF